MAIALKIRPDLVILIPEKREELTTEGRLDLAIHRDHIEDAIRSLQQGGISVSLSVDPDPDQIKMAHRINANKVEIYIGIFCNAETREQEEEAFQRIVNSAKMACKLKMGINAGHGLDYKTMKDFQGLREIDEFSIGHSIIARAVMVGMVWVVREMVALTKEL